MSIYGNRILHELQVNGKDSDDDDFNMDDTEGLDDDDLADGDDDFTMGDDTEEAPAEDNAQPAESGDDDFTLDDGEEAPADGGDTTQNDAPPADDAGGETTDAGGGDDFTMDAGGGDTEGGEEGGEAPADGGGEAPAGDGNAAPQAGIADPEQAEAEKKMYNSLSEDQKRIRTLELKVRYKNLYNNICSIGDAINNIPKNEDNIVAIDKIIKSLMSIKQILIDYIANNFDYTTYIENWVFFIKYYAIFNTITNILDELNAKNMDKK